MDMYYLFEYVFHIDDPLGASAIDMGAGIVGVLSVDFFASSEFTNGDAVGVFYGGSRKQLLWLLANVFTYFTWSFVTVGAVFMALWMAFCPWTSLPALNSPTEMQWEYSTADPGSSFFGYLPTFSPILPGLLSQLGLSSWRFGWLECSVSRKRWS